MRIFVLFYGSTNGIGQNPVVNTSFSVRLIQGRFLKHFQKFLSIGLLSLVTTIIGLDRQNLPLQNITEKVVSLKCKLSQSRLLLQLLTDMVE